MLRARRLAALLALLAPLALALPARSQADLRKPYHLRIVLHVARHRLLTDIFRQRLERDLRDGLQAALGELAHVEVVRDHPLLPKVLNEGLENALNGWADRSDVKTHFVLVDYSGVHYDVQARQFDGSTGRPSPVVRHDRVRDRAFVGKAAALLVKQDFGLLGSVQGDPEGGKPIPVQGRPVQVALRGGGLDVPWGRWVQPGDVFALFNARPGGSEPVLWAFAQVKEPPAEGSPDGVCTCRLFHRYALPNAAGLRCVKLGTVRAPLRLKFMRETPKGLVNMDSALSVHVRRHGFTGEDRLKLSTDATGAVDTSRDGEKGLFDQVAFVSVYRGDETNPIALVPVALVSDRQLVVEITTQRNDVATEVALKARTWQHDVAECYLVQVELFKKINSLTAKPDQLARALEEVRNTLERSKADRARLATERDALLAKARNLPKPAQPNLAASDRLLTQLESGENQLRKHLTQLEEDLRKENDPKRRDWLNRVNQGKLLEEDFEVGKAIKIYEKVLAEGFENADLSKHLEELKQKWEPKSEEHKDARQFIYFVWPTLDNAGLKANLPKAEQVLAVCKKEGDTIAAGRLFRATEAHAVRMKKESDSLHPDLIVDHEAPAKLIQEVAPGLEKLARDIQAFLNSKRPAE